MAARSALWSMGLDYNHGTGHGVGSFLNVHEGPQGISPRMRAQEEVEAAYERKLQNNFLFNVNVHVYTQSLLLGLQGRDDNIERTRLLRGRRVWHSH